jgi:hypothetical protein
MATDAGIGNGWRGWWRPAMWAAAALVLLAPLVAMRFTDQVDWSAADFALMGLMLAAACGAVELGARTRGALAYRAGFVLAVATAFVLAWTNLAVGFIGSEANPANLMYGGVLAVALVGGGVARLQPRGMASAMVAAAAAQAAAGAVALVAGWGDAVAPTVLFVALWLTSAWLFGKAAGESREAA